MAEKADQKQSDDKEFLAKVSSLMLDGWKMLGITCPSPSCGNCTLLRDREGVIQCVRCNKRFVTHQDSTKYFAAPPHPAFEDKSEQVEMSETGQVSAKEKLDQATAKMGELMLQGWAMLAENCPNPGCPGIPLMRKRGATTSVCLLCDAETAETAQEDKPTPPPTPAVPKVILKPTVDNSLQKKRDAVSSKMGAKLLSGWTMLSENCSDPNCRGTPLMSKGNSLVKLCVCCDKEFGKKPSPSSSAPPVDRSQGGSSSLSSASSLSSTAPSSYSKLGTMVESSSPVVPAAGESKLQKASNCVSNKLLIGWTMLSASCNDCDVPLMKHAKGSNGVPVCINTACEAYYETSTSTPLPPTSSISNLMSSEKLLNISELDGMSDEEEFEGEEFERVVASYKAKRSIDQDKSKNKPTDDQRNQIARVGIDSARKQALEVVAYKLSKASEELMASESASQDLQLAELIHRLASAAEALERRSGLGKE